MTTDPNPRINLANDTPSVKTFPWNFLNNTNPYLSVSDQSNRRKPGVSGSGPDIGQPSKMLGDPDFDRLTDVE